MISSIVDASTWNEYYEAHVAIYVEILQQRWALGTSSFAHHIHHPTIPDSSGALLGTVNWAAYSQPTTEGLKAFSEVFQTVLEREPQRKRTRYFMFTRDVLSGSDMTPYLVMPGADFWQDDFESALSVPVKFGPLDSLNAMFGRQDRAAVLRQELIDSSSLGSKVPIILRAAREAQQDIARSIIPTVLRNVLIDSCAVLTAIRCGWEVEQVVEWLQGRAGIAARIAAERARESGWGLEAQTFCESVLSAAPMEVEIYVVKPNDILGRIVREKYGLSLHELSPLIRALNPGLDEDKIRPKQEIALPVMS